VDSDQLVARGETLRGNGEINAAIGLLTQARQSADTPGAKSVASTALGVTYLQVRRLDDAEAALSAGYNEATAATRGSAAIELGNLALARKQNDRAEALYREALSQGGADSPLGIAARINVARLASGSDRLGQLRDIAQAIAKLPEGPDRPRLHRQLGLLALTLGRSGHELAYQQLDHTRALTAAAPTSREHLAALDGLGNLYEAQQRWADVIALSSTALARARAAPPGPIQDLLLEIEWRQGLAYRQTGRADLALAAYTRAVEHAHAIRPDLPIDTVDGRSTYQRLLKPLFEGYIELQLDVLATLPAERQRATLVSVRDALEGLRQAEMQDFLGDRCSTEEGDSSRLDTGVAVVYPIQLADRLELLTETRDGLYRDTAPVARAAVAAAAQALASKLRNGEEGYRPQAEQLYDWLIRPLEPRLQGLHTLVVVPDGALRLIPFAALHDGKAALIERIAVATVTGMSLTNSASPPGGGIVSLLAGLGEPGAVVDKLASTQIMRAATGGSRTLPAGPRFAGRAFRSATRGSARALSERDAQAMRESLALPGARDEVRAIARFLRGELLLDADFNVANFQQKAGGGDYRIVHIASHGVFGGTADTSFLLAHDDLVGINRLQQVLRSEKVQQNPIELLTLSACETAEGNDRAPLGIAGAAIRARAKTVLGTLWPVDDDAARQLMDHFYQGLATGGLSKAAALRQAQLALLRTPATDHPIFWAPFNLVGNWK
jgi:CHAT domain-containing protein